MIVRSTVQGVNAQALERFAARARRAVGLRGEVDVLITSSAELRRLNRRFRGKDAATDVLSFPSADGNLGDIAISAEVSAHNARRLGHSAGDELKILITSSAELRRLNRRFRGKDAATDVLSFPSADGNLGDIAISAEVSAHNARRLGHSAGDELKILILHGLLHLAGYDHETDGGAMARKEARLRRALGLPVALLERTASGTRHRAAKKRRS